MANIIGIVTVNWNSLEYSKEFIKDFLRLKKPGEILVVVNNDKQDNPQLNGLQSKEIVIINTNKNLGYSGGLNTGIKYLQEKTDCDWYLLINNDVKITREIMNKFRSLSDKNAIHSPVIVNIHDDIVQNTGGRTMLVYGGTINLNKGRKYKEIVKIEPDFLSGCCMLMHKNIVEKIGLFYENYGSYFEDVDYCYRAKNAGIKLTVLWDLMLRHYHSMSTKNNSGYKDYLISRNSILFARKLLYFPRRQIYIFFSILMGFLWVLPRPKNLPYFFRGVYQGLKS